jgi:hypothetical protein
MNQLSAAWFIYVGEKEKILKIVIIMTKPIYESGKERFSCIPLQQPFLIVGCELKPK